VHELGDKAIFGADLQQIFVVMGCILFVEKTKISSFKPAISSSELIVTRLRLKTNEKLSLNQSLVSISGEYNGALMMPKSILPCSNPNTCSTVGTSYNLKLTKGYFSDKNLTSSVISPKK